MKMTQEQAEKLLLNKQNIEDFFNTKARGIFGSPERVQVTELKRSKTLNPTSLNVYYGLNIAGKIINVRASSSTKYDTDYNYKTLKYLQKNGLSIGNILVAKPYAFFDEYNLMFYEDIQGEIFTEQLGSDLDKLLKNVKLAAEGLKKVHSIKKVPYKLWDHDWFFDNKLIQKYYPELTNIQEIKQKIMNKISKNKNTNLCHGDFQPDNLIFTNDQLCIIDWGSVTIAQAEMDLASFTAKLEIMMPEFGNSSNTDLLIKTFLDAYGQFDLETYNHFRILYSIRILNSFAEFPDYENAKKRMNLADNMIEENLKRSGI